MKMDKKEGLCSAGGSDVEEEVMVPGNSAVAVYFTIVPLITGNIPITVLAYASDTVNDKVEKELRVEVKCVKLVYPDFTGLQCHISKNLKEMCLFSTVNSV